MENAMGSLQPSLPREAYLDEAVFEAERRAVFGRSWLTVCRADRLPEPGDYLVVEPAGESVLLIRGRDGVLRAFRNLCRHRGAVLCRPGAEDGQGGEGRFGSALSCPYHGWAYGLDGRLVGAPNMPEMPDLVKAEYGLHQVRLTEWLGYVWLNLDPDAPSLAEQVEPELVDRFGTTETLDRYRIESLVPGRTVVYDVAANWKCVVENFMECYHCGTLHPELTAALPQFATGWGTVSGGVGAGAALAPGLAAFSSSGVAVRPRLPGLLDSDDRLFFGVILRPNTFLILVPDHVALFRLEPHGPARTTVVVDWLFEPAAVTAEGFDPDDAVGLLDVTNRQDWDACERCQLGMASPAYDAVLVPSEHLVTGFHDWVRDRLAAG
jgi:glycine betaine catabolism A